MQIYKNIFCLAITIGILLAANESFARAQNLFKAGNNASTNNDTQTTTTGTGNGTGGGGKKYKFIDSSGNEHIVTVSQLEQMGEIKNPDGSVWMNGPGTFPGIKAGESVPVQSIAAKIASGAVAAPAPVPAVDAVNAAAAPSTAAPQTSTTAAQGYAPSPTTAAPSANPSTATRPAETAAAPANNPVPPANVGSDERYCFHNKQEWETLKSRLPERLKTIPLNLVVGGTGFGTSSKGGGIKVSTNDNGKFVIVTAVHAKVAIFEKTVLNEQMMESFCYEPSKKAFMVTMDDATSIQLKFESNGNVRMDHNGATVHFKAATDSEFNTAFDLIYGGASAADKAAIDAARAGKR